MTEIKRSKDRHGNHIAKVTFTLRECIESEKKVIDILNDIEGKSVFLRDAVTRMADSDYFEKNRANLYDGPGHHRKPNK